MKPSLKVKLYDSKFLLLVAFGVSIICIMIMYPFLPNDLPMQFSSSGDVNWSLPKAIGIWCIPAIAAFISANYIRTDRFSFGQLASIILLLLLNIGFLGYIAFLR